MSGDWKCRKCGKINVEFIGTCECGGLKEDGIQTNEDKREEKRKWQCPECLKINDRDYCSCGYVRTDADKYIEEKTDSDQPVATNKSGTKKKIIRVAIIVAAIICVAIVVKNVFFRSNNKAKVVEYDCNTGMLINMNLETFCSELNNNINNAFVETTGENPGFDITNYMNNLVEPMVDYESGSGCKFTAYSAFVYNTYLVEICVVDDKIKGVNVVINMDDNSMPTILAVGAIQTLSGLDFYECIEIRDTILNGIMGNTWVYKDGILFGIEINSSYSSYFFFPVSEEFLEKAKDNAQIIYWE